MSDITVKQSDLVPVGPPTGNVKGTEIEVDGKKLLVLVVDTTLPTHPSSKGKMQMLASSGGLVFVPGSEWKVGLNVGK